MDNKNKGLVDNDEGDFILNESGTSVTVDPVHDDFKADDPILDSDLPEEGNEADKTSDEG